MGPSDHLSIIATKIDSKICLFHSSRLSQVQYFQLMALARHIFAALNCCLFPYAPLPALDINTLFLSFPIILCANTDTPIMILKF